MRIFEELIRAKQAGFSWLCRLGFHVREVSVKTSITIVLATVILVMASHNASAQKGGIIGQVEDFRTGETLAGADVVLQGTRYAVRTDEAGRFALRGIPEGNYNLMVRAVGYGNHETSVSVTVDDHTVKNVGLSDKNPVEGDRLFLEREREVTQALSRQQKAPGIASIITAEQIRLFGDYSVQDALARVSGVQVNHMGEVNIRGVGLNRYNVTIDGRRIATTGMGDRSVDLAGISADMLRSIELIKVLTPDMHADAMAGSVNLVTRRPVGKDLILGGQFGGGANPRYFKYTGPESRAAFHYAQALHEDVHLALEFNQQLQSQGWESLALDYGLADFGTGPVDVYERIIPSLNTATQNRLGGRFQLTYQPSAITSINVQGLLSHYGMVSNRHRNIWDTGGAWLSQDETGAQGGSLVYDAQLQDTKINHYSLQAGASHVLKSFDLHYHASWSHGRSNQMQYQFPFLVDRLNFSLDIDDKTRPSMMITNLQLLQDGTLDRRRYNFQPVDRVRNNHIDNTFAGNVDLEIPFRLGSVKLGSSAVLTYKKGAYNDANYTFSRINLLRFNLIRRGDFDVLDHYRLPYLINTDHTREFFQSSRPGFTKNVDMERERSDIWNYKAEEQIYSGYGMTTVRAGRFTLLAGVRLEHTVASNQGRRVLLGENGAHISTTPGSSDKSYTHLFPNVHLIYSPADQINIRAAWTQSIARPDFNVLAPFELVNARDSLIFRGNPNLDPLVSDNLDLLFEYYYLNTGALSIGLFHKNISGFVAESQRMVSNDGEFAGWQHRTYENVDETAAIYGIEFSWQQNLVFLPGFLSRMATYANYTWTDSVYETNFRDKNTTFPNQSPHVINAALQYRQGRFYGQLAYHWTASYLSNLQQEMQLVPSIDPAQSVYMDRYEDGWTDISVSMRIRISDNFRFWIDAYNLLNVERVQYDHTRELYPRETVLMGGRGFRTGLRVDL